MAYLFFLLNWSGQIPYKKQSIRLKSQTDATRTLKKTWEKDEFDSHHSEWIAAASKTTQPDFMIKIPEAFRMQVFFFFLVNNYFTNGINTYITNLNKYIHTERLAIKSSEKGFLANFLFFRFPLCKYMLFSSIHFWNSTLKRSCHLLCLNQEPLECQENVAAVASSELDIMDEVR